MPKITAAEPLSIELIKEIHAILTAGTYDERRFLDQGERPGDFKRHDYVTGILEVGSFPEDVEQDITELLEEIADAPSNTEPAKTLTTAAYLHARFENIHPFADGNGRVGRSLVNYYLMTHRHPPLIVYEDNRSEYYMALQNYDENEDINPLITFFQQQVEKTWEKKLSRVLRRKK